MLGFLYSVLLKLLYPTSLAFLLLVAGIVLHKRRKASLICQVLAAGILLVCGNGWVSGAMVRHLESRYPEPKPVPSADAIVVLSGGIQAKLPPRRTVEVGEAGDRVLYGAQLFHEGKAKKIVCTGNAATGSTAQRPIASEMAELLERLNVPPEQVIVEVESTNTREHARNLREFFHREGITNVLLVTSAMHMPRSIGVFRKLCPEIAFTPAPTDFQWSRKPPAAWYRSVTAVIPTPRNLMVFSDAFHEYLGMLYYRVRGWI